MTKTIPCTVQILTRNSAKNLERCLKMLAPFGEVIIHDGNSTDGTREIAKTFPNVRLMDQNPSLLTPEGRIKNFSAMRNESIFGAKYDWIFIIDADEEIPQCLIDEVGEVVNRGIPEVYEVFRRFYVNGEAIMFCSGYPAPHIRLFHRSCTTIGYAKAVHERLMLQDGVQVKMLRTELPVPFLPAKELKPKYDRYVAMEVKRVGVMPMGKWFRWVFLRNIKTCIGITVRVLQHRLSLKRGKRMPLVYEWQGIEHSLRTLVRTFPPLAKRELERDKVKNAAA